MVVALSRRSLAAVAPYRGGLSTAARGLSEYLGIVLQDAPAGGGRVLDQL
jgi:hypothetical protein